MDKALKQRMVGAVVLIALGVIFIPMLLDTSSEEDGTRSVELDIPAAPNREYRSRLLPLDERGEEPDGESGGQVERETGSVGSEPAEAESEPVPQPQAGTAERSTTGSAADGPSSNEVSGSDEAETEPEPAEAESRPAEEPAKQPLGNWFVQVGSFSREANATDLRDRLRSAGYTAFVETSTVEGQTKHRVKIGPEMDRASAERQRDRIQTEFDLKGIVVSEP